jgi:UDP-2,4-diacetamido-2,4,6-trideoxy-beta-L-altropyranose hydrolase
LKPDWLVVDHYALDMHWETELHGLYGKLLVIDDLADRAHSCDLLLDQNLGRQASDYAHFVPMHCTVLAGPQYALLRPEFAALREYSLKRREAPVLKRLLITMGGVDQPNATGQVLEALKASSLLEACHITVVMGSQAPWLSQVREVAANMPWPTEVRVDINDMAQVMAESDLAIGAAGGTSWERCCLGLPTLMVVLAENQWGGAQALQAVGAARLIGDAGSISMRLTSGLSSALADCSLTEMTRDASSVTDGKGVMRVVQQMVYSK